MLKGLMLGSHIPKVCDEKIMLLKNFCLIHDRDFS